MYQIGKPITWEEFKSYPKEMQQKWIDAFKERFECGSKGMEILFGILNTSIARYCVERGLMVTKAGRINDEKKASIRAWIAEERGTPVAVPVEEPKPKKAEAQKPVQSYFVNTLQNGSMRLSGTSSEIFQTLFGIFREARLSVSIDFEVLPVIEEPVVEEEPVAEPEPKENPKDNGLPDLNTCPFDTLRALGWSVNLALNTVKKRPFAKIEDLAQVPGMTETGYKILSQKVQVL